MSSIALITALVAAASALAMPGLEPRHGSGYGSSHSWNLKKFTSLVVFGDSYSDDSRLGYFITNNGSAPPVGWVDPVVGLSEMELRIGRFMLTLCLEQCLCRRRSHLGRMGQTIYWRESL